MIEFQTSDSDEFKEEKQKETEKETKGYRLGTFEDFTNLVPEDAIIWYSFDKTYKNFHIVPDKKTKVQNTEKTLSEWLRNRLDTILDAIIKKLPNSIITITKEQTNYKKGTLKVDNKEYLLARSEGRECTINHKWISIIDKESKYEYLLLPCRLWCDDKKQVNNSFGKIQFMRYPYKPDREGRNKVDINKINGKFTMMYPSSDAEGKGNKESGHYVYNPEGLTIKSKPEEIAKKFIEFIEGKLG